MSDTASLPNRLVASVSQPGSARATPRLFQELLRLLTRGEPVTVDRLTAAVKLPADDVQRAVAGWNDTEYDEQGRIIGWVSRCWLRRIGSASRGNSLYTWCALDTLFFPAVIGRPARVESPCAETGEPDRLTVDPTAGVSALQPASAVVSIVTPEK